jgi:ATP-dependent Lon protease
MENSFKINLSDKIALPLVVTKDLVIFPDMIVSFFVGRNISLKAVEEVQKTHNTILIATQKNPEQDTIEAQDIQLFGSLVEILQVVNMPDNTTKILVKGLKRVKLSDIKLNKIYFVAKYSLIQDSTNYDEGNLEDIKVELLDNFTNYINNSKKIAQPLLMAIKKIEKLHEIVDAISSHLSMKNEDKMRLLESTDLLQRVAYLNSLLEVELDMINVEKKIRERVKKQMEKNQKDYYLNEQIKAIQKELNGEDGKDESKELLEKLKNLKISNEGREKVEGEVKKLAQMNPISAEASVVRNYIDWLLTLPWGTKNNIKIDLKKAEEYLEKDHHALNKVKERILEYIAVLKKSSNLKAPILCLVGPPGVGKTSLAKSLAKAAGREFVRISLGGVRDEAEIRGHRRTYIGAMPGKVIQAIKKSKVSNPLILLDEIDKMGSDFRGDPASALLEVLDPEQNSTFVDHYIEVEYDLSNVMFITTANSFNIQEALLDRMEIIELTGYSEEEKLEIAKKHLLSRKMQEAALSTDEFSITDEAILWLIRSFTRESGVRELDRVLAKVARKVARDIVQKSAKQVKLDIKNIIKYAGNPKFIESETEKEPLVGITTGLAWTRVGGDILYIEALKLPGKGNLKLTGKLGEVMQESVKAAYSMLQANSKELEIDPESFSKHDIHIHVPEGATPKDGPSAGVAMTTSIYSVITNKKVRSDIAMTGEITLRGKVLPIGGVREKLLAALRHGIKNVIIPKENEKDLIDLPKSALEQLNVITVSNFREVLENAMVSADKKTVKENSNKNKKNSK